MPGTILLEDFKRANDDELSQHLNGLFGRDAPGGGFEPSSIPSQIPVEPPAPPEPPAAPPQELQNHVDSLLSTPPAPTPAPPTPTPTPSSNVVQELADHVSNATGGALKWIGEGITNLQQGAQQATSGLTNLLPPQPAAPSPQPAAPGAPSPDVNAPQGPLQDFARQMATRAGIDPNVFVRQIQQESGFNPGARSPAGATGIAQFMPGTARGLGIDPSDPYQALEGAARLMKSNLDRYGGDYAKALASYNAGPGAVDRYGGVPPFEETRRYVSTILGGAAQTVGEVAGTIGRAVGDISQFGDAQLTNSQAYAACGPAAAVRFAQRFGRNPTLKESVDLARTVGWTEEQGMAGLSSEKALMDKMGVPTKMVQGADWGTFANEARTGNPVTISTRGHYFTADGWDPRTNRFHVGRSGLDLKGGSEWMTPEQMTAVMGPVQGGLLADNPQAPTSTVATAAPSGAPAAPPARQGIQFLGDEGQTAAGFTAPGGPGRSFLEQAAGTVGEGFSRLGEAAQGGLTILDNAIDSSASGGPLSAAMQPTPSDVLTNPLGTGNAPSQAGLPLPAELGLPVRQDLRDIAQEPRPTVFDALGTGVRTAERALISPEGELQMPPEESVAAASAALQRGIPGLSLLPSEPVRAAGAALAPLAKGPLLLSQQELLAQASPEQIETARQYARLGHPRDRFYEPSESDIAEALRGFRIGEAAAMTGGTGAAGEAATAAENVAKRAGGIDYDALAQLRARAERAAAQPPPAPPPGSAERADWLLGKGKWAPPPAAVEPNLADRALAFTVNNMLSNPASLIANAAGGLMETAKRPIVTAGAAGVEALTGNLPGARTQLGAAGADVRAMGLAVGDALADAATTFGTGRRASRAVDQPEAFGGVSGVVATPFLRVMGATDEFVSGLNSAGSQGAELVRQMRAHPDLSQAEVMSQFQNEILTAGQHGAVEAIFQTGGSGLGGSLARARRQLTAPEATPGERIRGAAAQVLVPFSSVPDVILTRGALRVPGVNELLTSPIQIAKAMRAGDPVAAKRAAASGMLATMTNLAIYTQVQEGNITGSGPDDPAKKRALMQARDENGNPLWRPNSIKVGGQWVPYSSLGGVAIQLGSVANAVEQYEYAGKQVNPDMAKAVGSALGDTITDAWYLQTLAGVFQALGPNGKLPEWLGTQALSTAGGVIPEAAFLNTMKKLTDPTAREAEPKLADPATWLEYFAARIPGVSQTVKPKLDPATGRPIEEPQTIPSVLTRGTAPGESNPVNEILARHNLGVGDAPNTITPAEGLTIAINDQEQRRFTELAGPEVEKRILAMSRNASFQRAPLDQQRDLLQEVIGDGRAVAAVKVFQSLPKGEQLRRIREYEAAQKRQAEPAVRLP